MDAEWDGSFTVNESQHDVMARSRVPYFTDQGATWGYFYMFFTTVCFLLAGSQLKVENSREPNVKGDCLLPCDSQGVSELHHIR